MIISVLTWSTAVWSFSDCCTSHAANWSTCTRLCMANTLTCSTWPGRREIRAPAIGRDAVVSCRRTERTVAVGWWFGTAQDSLCCVESFLNNIYSFIDLRKIDECSAISFVGCHTRTHMIENVYYRCVFDGKNCLHFLCWQPYVVCMIPPNVRIVSPLASSCSLHVWSDVGSIGNTSIANNFTKRMCFVIIS